MKTFVPSCVCILVHRPLLAKSQACCWSCPQPSCFCFWRVRILSEPEWRKPWSCSSLMEGIVSMITHTHHPVIGYAHSGDRCSDFMTFSLTCQKSLSLPEKMVLIAYWTWVFWKLQKKHK